MDSVEVLDRKDNKFIIACKNVYCIEINKGNETLLECKINNERINCQIWESDIKEQLTEKCVIKIDTLYDLDTNDATNCIQHILNTFYLYTDEIKLKHVDLYKQ